MSDDSPKGRPEALGKPYKPKYVRNAEKKARQIAAAADKNRRNEAAERAERWPRFVQEREQRSDKIRAEHLEAGPLPIEEETHTEFDDGTREGIYSSILHDPEEESQLNDAFQGWLQGRMGLPLDLLKTPYADAVERLRAQTWRGQPIGERRWEAWLLHTEGKSAPKIAAIMHLNEKTIDTYIGYVRDYLDKVRL